MLFAHKLIDGLLGQSKKIPLRIPVERPAGFDPEGLVPLILESTKFDFGTVHSEQTGIIELDGKIAPKIRTPQLTDDERGWWIEGFFPLPFPLVWYEFSFLKGIKHGAIIEDRNDSWYVKFIDFNVEEGHFAYNGSTLRVSRSAGSFDGSGEDAELIFEVSPAIRGLGPEYEERMTNLWSGKITTLIYLTIALGSKTTERKVEAASAKLNHSRSRRGRASQFEHTVVNISPSKFISSGDGDGTHASPRVHKRRSHKRHLDHEVPGSKLVTTGANAGKWAIVIPWCWVNKANASDPLLQEYRVRLN